MHLLLEFHKMSVDEAIENVLKFYTTKENKEKIRTRICKLAAFLDPSFADHQQANLSQTPFPLPYLKKKAQLKPRGEELKCV